MRPINIEQQAEIIRHKLKENGIPVPTEEEAIGHALAELRRELGDTDVNGRKVPVLPYAILARILAADIRKEPPKRYRMVCEECGSPDISAKTYNLVWNVELQRWTVGSGLDIEETYCGQCGGEVGDFTRREITD